LLTKNQTTLHPHDPSDKRPKLERAHSAAEKENQPLQRANSMLRRQYSQQESSTRRMSATEMGVDMSPNQRRMYTQQQQQQQQGQAQFQRQQSYQQPGTGGVTGHHVVQINSAYGMHQQAAMYPEDDPKYYQVSGGVRLG
jgi:regulating synaptic membrane exocytosis protein 2